MAGRSRPRRYARDLRRRSRGNPWVHLGLLAVGLAVILVFGGRAADNAAGCFSSVSDGEPAKVIDRADEPTADVPRPPPIEGRAVNFGFRLPDAVATPAPDTPDTISAPDTRPK